MQKKSVLALLILVLFATVSCATVSGASDEAIRENIRDQIRAEFPNTTLPISIQVMNGQVTLNGIVNTNEQRSTIAQIARNAEGVRGVSNHLSVSS